MGEQHALENHDVMLSAAHREVLDREREARLRREVPTKRKDRDDSESSSDGSDDSDGSGDRKRRRKEHKEHKKSSKKEKKHKHKKDKKDKHKKDRDADGSKAANEPVALSAFLAAQSDS